MPSWAPGAASSAPTSASSSRSVDRTIVATYVGAGARLPLHRRLDVFADWRAIVTGDDAAEMAVFMPLRVGVSVRF